MVSVPPMQFELDPDDEYDKFCGKVFLTTKNNIIFHCTLCESKFFGCEVYIEHVKAAHCSDPVDVEYDELDVEDELPLEEDEFPITTLQKKTDIKVLHARNDTSAASTSETVLEELENTITTRAEIETLNIVESREEKSVQLEDRSRRIPIVPSNKGTFECPHCPLRFTLQFTLREHLKDHEVDRIFKCSICGVQFKKKFSLKSHMQRHQVEKRHKCTECSRSFVNPSELRYHQRKHNGEKPYQCESCGLAYAYKSNLRLHRKRHHTHQPDYPCPLCSKKYYTSRHLRDHMTKHTNEAIYKCDKCGKDFKQSSTFQRHKAQHRMQEEAEKTQTISEDDTKRVENTVL